MEFWEGVQLEKSFSEPARKATWEAPGGLSKGGNLPKRGQTAVGSPSALHAPEVVGFRSLRVLPNLLFSGILPVIGPNFPTLGWDMKLSSGYVCLRNLRSIQGDPTAPTSTA